MIPFRNNREVVAPDVTGFAITTGGDLYLTRIERKINWRLYKELSGGLMTELGSHQLEVSNWATGLVPESVIGMGDTVFWKRQGSI